MYQEEDPPAEEEELPRRGSLGLELRSSSLEVLRVVPGSTSDLAGVMPGDTIATIDGEGVETVAQLSKIARSLRPGARVVFLVDRVGVATVLEGTVMPAPVEEVRGAAVRLGHVDGVDGVYKLRTIATVPINHPPPFTAVLLLAGLGHGSCELPSDPDDPRRRLIEDLTELGLVTLRVERSGTGDSEGPPATTTDLFTEIAGYRAVLDALKLESDIEGTILFGHSVGGMVAPFLAGASSGVTGIAVFGTTARRWSDSIIDGTRRQRILAGSLEGEALEEHVAAWAEMHTRVLQGDLTPAEVFELHPALRSLEGPSCTGRTMFGRDVAYFQQLERLDLAALWRTTKVPVLVMAGTNDWVISQDDAQRIASIAPTARLVEIEDVGHDMLRHQTLARSFHSAREGRWDGSVTKAFAAWLDRVRTG